MAKVVVGMHTGTVCVFLFAVGLRTLALSGRLYLGCAAAHAWQLGTNGSVVDSGSGVMHVGHSIQRLPGLLSLEGGGTVVGIVYGPGNSRWALHTETAHVLCWASFRVPHTVQSQKHWSFEEGILEEPQFRFVVGQLIK